ncbi:MAG TPA: heme-binding protein [Pseudomonas sp.]|nr:heme-binding protein [Pseudomonas sp.]
MSRWLHTQTSISLALAMQALQAALNEAGSLEVKVSIAILDAAGNLLHMAHMDGAPGLSREIARRKAATAVAFGVPTAAWEERLQQCSPAVRQGLPLQEGLALFGGGEPFLVFGCVAGGIGVSGASEQLDTQCAQAAVRCGEGLLASN